MHSDSASQISLEEKPPSKPYETEFAGKNGIVDFTGLAPDDLIPMATGNLLSQVENKEVSIASQVNV